MIPSFPPDATILSIHLACLRAGREANLSRSVQTFYQGPLRNINNRFGYKTKTFAKFALDSRVSGEDLLNSHSMFPLVSSMFTEGVTSRWREALDAGHPEALSRFAPHSRLGFKSALRLCPACVDSDAAQYGLAHWHVCHQSPAMRFCPTHKQLLHSHCEACKTPFGENNKWLLPGDPCHHCGSQATGSGLSSQDSDGYRSLAQTILRALAGKAPELAPSVRHRVLRNMFVTSGTSAEALLELFLAWWSVDSLNELDVLLETTIRPRAVLKLLEYGHAQVSMLLLLAAVAFAWAHTSDSDRALFLDGRPAESDLFICDSSVVAEDDEVLAELAVIAQQLHLSAYAAQLLAQGNQTLAFEQFGATNVFLLFEGVPPHVRQHIYDRVRAFKDGRRK